MASGPPRRMVAIAPVYPGVSSSASHQSISLLSAAVGFLEVGELAIGYLGTK